MTTGFSSSSSIAFGVKGTTFLSSNPEKKSENATCKLCLESVNDKISSFVINSCQCIFCKQCMQCYVEVLVHDGVVLSITCPDAECSSSGVLNEDEIRELVQPSTFEMYQRLKFEQEVAVDPHRTFCPEAKCSSVCHVCNDSSKLDQNLQTFSVSCPMCHLQFCFRCKAKWRADHKCSNFPLTTSFGSEFQKFQAKTGRMFNDDSLIKRCPVCNVFIEKNNGCAQMTCRNCSHIFCWYCLKVLDNDFLLRHYDKGPCRDKLGHSRSQIIRHRLGVVALFAAFCLLLVVASPVIFIVLPVILCYRCRKSCAKPKTSLTSENSTSLTIDQSHGKPNVMVEVRLNIPDSYV